MKKLITVFLAISWVLPICSQDDVNIPDANFLAALIEVGVDTNEDGKISNAEAEAVTHLYVSPENNQHGEISDMTGLHAFVNLDTLSCMHNSINELDVSNNTALEYLDCHGNPLNSLNVSSCHSLKFLDCSGGWDNLSSLDIAGCTELTHLDCGLNNLSILNLSNNPALTVLYCDENQLTSLDVKNNTALIKLTCCGNQLTSLDVSSCPHLEVLAIGREEVIYGGGNLISNLDLSNNLALNTLDVFGNPLTSLDLSNNPNLEYLDCHDIPLSILVLSGNTLLETIFCTDTELTSLNVHDCYNLRSFSCSGGTLTYLDFSNSRLLEYLAIDIPSLERVCVWDTFFEDSVDIVLNLSGSPNAYFSTECGGNIVEIPDGNFLAALIEQGVDTDEDGQISNKEAENQDNLNVIEAGIADMTGIEAFVNLDTLHCGGNEFTELDISMNTDLVVFTCGSSHLSSIDLSSNTKLDYLGISNSQLESIDLSNNTRLIILKLSGNFLTSLDLCNNTLIGSQDWTKTELKLKNMPTLKEVFVWESFPDGVIYDISGSPNVDFVDCTDGIAEERKRDIRIFPNPISSFFTLEIATPIKGELDIHSLNGQLIHRRPITSTSDQIDMSSYAKGIYFVTLRSDAGVKTEKVVKY